MTIRDTKSMLFDQYSGGARPNDASPFIRSLLESLPQPIFLRCVVLEYLIDPGNYTDDRRQEIRKRFDAKLELLEVAPNNSLIVAPVRGGGEVVSRPLLLFPFFGSHHVSPVKVGEHVWAMFESQETRELGYWMTRIAENRHVEDPNHTHADRRWKGAGLAGIRERAGASQPDDPTPDFPNGMGIPETFSLYQSDAQNAYDKLQNDSDSAKLGVNEPVPRFRKRPGDHVFAGSNNQLIVFGTDRTSAAAETDQSGKVTDYPPADQSLGSGMIDIVVGRGQTDTTAEREIKNSRGKMETDKRPEDSKLSDNPSEGDPDYQNDLTRLFLSMLTDADQKLGIFDLLPNVNAESAETAPAAVIKSDQLRFIARQDIKIVVAPPGADVTDPYKLDNFASFVIKKDGNIVFVPSRNGFIKLGGDNADRGIICTDYPVDQVDGQVIAEPLTTTMGGQIGTTQQGIGQFCPKILVVGD